MAEADGFHQVLWTLSSSAILVVTCQLFVYLLWVFLYTISPPSRRIPVAGRGRTTPSDGTTAAYATVTDSASILWRASLPFPLAGVAYVVDYCRLLWTYLRHVPRTTTAHLIELFFLGLAGSTLIADALFHLIPEAFEAGNGHDHAVRLGLWALVGMILVFVVEGVVHSTPSVLSRFVKLPCSAAEGDDAAKHGGGTAMTTTTTTTLAAANMGRAEPPNDTHSALTHEVPTHDDARDVGFSGGSSRLPGLPLHATDSPIAAAASSVSSIPGASETPSSVLRQRSLSSSTTPRGYSNMVYHDHRHRHHHPCYSHHSFEHDDHGGEDASPHGATCAHGFAYLLNDEHQPKEDEEDIIATGRNQSLPASIQAQRRKRRTVAWANLIASSIHNLVDGAAIGAAFLSSTPIPGIATVVSIFAHEVPAQMANFILLLRGDFPPFTAFMLNFAACAAVQVGALISLLGGGHDGAQAALQMLAAGNFLCLGLAMLIPQLQEILWNPSTAPHDAPPPICVPVALAGLGSGVALMALLGLVEHHHD